MDWLAFLQVEYISVTTEAGVARPFVTRKGNEALVLVKLAREIILVMPKWRSNLEIVALVGGCIEKGKVACESMKFTSRVCTDGFLGLAVQVAPVGE